MARASTSFKPGQSGNPAGRAAGVNHRAKFRTLLAPHMPEVLEAVIAAAKNGDMQACRICIDRLVPSLKPTSDSLNIKTTGTLEEQGMAIIRAMTTGQVTPDQAKTALDALAIQARLIDQGEILTRMKHVEALLCPTSATK